MIFNTLKEKTTPLLNTIIDLPFNQELAQGTLPTEKFIFYIQQDYLYLHDFSRALAMTASKLSNHQHIKAYLEFALGAIEDEHSLHRDYLRKFSASNLNLTPSPSCFMYTNFLLNTAANKPAIEAVASLLPCFWIYQKVGQFILENSNVTDNHPYKDWIYLYASDDFAIACEKAIHILNELATTQDYNENDVMNAFHYAAKLEWLFWDSAYHLEQWPV